MAGIAQSSPSAIFFIVPQEIVPDRVFGRRLTVIAILKAATGPIFVPDQLHDLLFYLQRRLRDAALQHDESARLLAFERVLDADHRAFRDVLMRGKNLLHPARREPMPCDIDDIVSAAHDEQVAVLVDEPCVRRVVEARKCREVTLLKSVIGMPQRGQATGWQRQLDHDGPHRVGTDRLSTLVDDLHVIAWHGYCRRTVLDRQGAKAKRISRDCPARLGLPPMVDHRRGQIRSAHWTVSGSALSPARNNALKPLMS